MTVQIDHGSASSFQWINVRRIIVDLLHTGIRTSYCRLYAMHRRPSAYDTDALARGSRDHWNSPRWHRNRHAGSDRREQHAIRTRPGAGRKRCQPHPRLNLVPALSSAAILTCWRRLPRPPCIAGARRSSCTRRTPRGCSLQAIALTRSRSPSRLASWTTARWHAGAAPAVRRCASIRSSLRASIAECGRSSGPRTDFASRPRTHQARSSTRWRCRAFARATPLRV